MKLWIDCDTGVDDSIALLFALGRPDVEILGISTATGNTTAARGAENTLRLLKLCGFEGKIPVYVGAETNLRGDTGPFPTFIHGENGLGNAELPPTDQKPEKTPPEEALYEAACRYPGELTLVTLGRMTNIALALERHPDLPQKLPRVVSMGGTLYAPGNVSPVCEANLAGDPEAADRVMGAGWDMTLVGLDVTTAVRLTRSQVESLGRVCRPHKKPWADYVARALDFYMEGSRQAALTLDYCPLHDPLAMIAALEPRIMETRKMPTRVECGGTYCRGMVVADLRPRPMKAPWVTHCLRVHSRLALDLLFEALS